MKITLKYLGPVKEFTFDLDKDLHIIYGENNIGKSYAISSVYLLLKNFSSNNLRSSRFYQFSGGKQYDDPSVTSIVNFIRENKDSSPRTELSIKGLCEIALKDALQTFYINQLRRSFKNSFSNFDIIQSKFSKEKFQIILDFGPLKVTLSLKKNQLNFDAVELDKDVVIKIISSPRKRSEQDGKWVYYVNKSGFDDTHTHSLQENITFLIQALWNNAWIELANNLGPIYFLPASRSGLYQAMSIFGTLLAKLSQFRYEMDSGISIPALSEPLSDYFLHLTSIKRKQSKNKLVDIAQNIEKNILGAEIRFNDENKQIEYYSSKTGLKLDLSETSSMVSEIAPIVAFLKYVMVDDISHLSDPMYEQMYVPNRRKTRGKPLIFIEEPEAHLHPKVQVEMMKIFASMVNNNVKVVMTTHSDFMLSKLTNLLLSDTIPASKVASYHMIMTKNGSYDAGNMKANEEGIEDYNFIDVTEQLYEERINLLEKQNSNASK